MDPRWPPRTVGDPKVRQVGFFVSPDLIASSSLPVVSVVSQGSGEYFFRIDVGTPEPASSSPLHLRPLWRVLLQTLLLRGLNPSEVFQSLSNSYRKLECSSSVGFDLLVQGYVQNMRVLVVRLMRECEMLSEVRTLNALLNGLVKIRHFNLVLQLFDEMINVGLRPDVYMYTAAVKSLCELSGRGEVKRVEERGEGGLGKMGFRGCGEGGVGSAFFNFFFNFFFATWHTSGSHVEQMWPPR